MKKAAAGQSASGKKAPARKKTSARKKKTSRNSASKKTGPKQASRTKPATGRKAERGGKAAVPAGGPDGSSSNFELAGVDTTKQDARVALVDTLGSSLTGETSLLERVGGGGQVPDLELPDAGELEDVVSGTAAEALVRSLAGDEPPAVEKLIGGDDRRRVASARDYPFHCVCYLLIETSFGRLISGTGWLVAPRLVITAAHCVYRRDERSYVRSIQVHPGADGGRGPMQLANKFVVNDRYSSAAGDERVAYDYGAIVLGQAFPRTGTLGVGVYSDQLLDGSTLSLVGYPTDKPARTMWYHARPLALAGPRILRYQIDTFPGQSGAPLIDRVPHQGQDRYVAVGIHSGSVCGRPLNRACRITQDVWQNIDYWRSTYAT